MSVLYSLGASLLSAASELVEMSLYEGEPATDDEDEETQRESGQEDMTLRNKRQQQQAHCSPQPRVRPHHVGRSPSHQLLSNSVSGSSSSPLPSCACVASMSAADCPVTPFIVEFAAAIAEHPTTFTSFPLCCPAAASSSAFRLSPAQLVHARLLLASCPPFARLRLSLCPAVIDELRLWRVYFTLLRNISSRQQPVRDTITTAQHKQAATAETQGAEGCCQPMVPAGPEQAAAEEEEAEAMRQEAEREELSREQSLLTLAEVEEFMDALLVRLGPQPPCCSSPPRSASAAAELNVSVNSSRFHTPSPAPSQQVSRYSLSCCGGSMSVITSPSSLLFSPSPAMDDSDCEDASFSLSISSLSRTPSPPSSPSFSGSGSSFRCDC